MPYKFLEAVALADIAFRAEGSSLEEVFAAASDATMNVMVDNLDSIQAKEGRALVLENSALDLLLFDLLQELIYYKDSEQLLLRVRQLSIRQEGALWKLTGEAQGEKLNPARHRQRADVKAVTLHHFKLEKTDAGWTAMVVLDI
jgi:SHS2 domain-containing protein